MHATFHTSGMAWVLGQSAIQIICAGSERFVCDLSTWYLRFLFVKGYTASPAEAEFDGLTAGFETIQLCP